MTTPIKSDPFRGCLRQVHLDFHNSPFIDDLLADFDPQRLARQFKDAHVNSVIVFAKCVHGMGYYPSKIVEPHPSLKGRDFTGEMIEALHREGIRAPIYTIIGWEENLATKCPEWLQICDDGTFAQNAFSSDGTTPQPGRYRWLNFLHPDYQDYFEAHLDELLDLYPADGFFLDMLVVHPRADWSDEAVVFREKNGLLGRDARTHARFEAAAQATFAEKFSAQIRARAPQASIFYNAENRLFTDGALGVLARAGAQTHFEIESLPAGMWNYHHFPRIARNLSRRGHWLGMTGKFQKMWGDFGGIKPAPALEFECFRTQAMGGANSIGDQLHPRGRMETGTCRLIGGVLQQCAEAEAFYEGTTTSSRITLLCPHDPDISEKDSTLVEEGVISLCQQEHYECTIIHDRDDLEDFDLVILGENTRLTPESREHFAKFAERGGKLLVAGSSAFTPEGNGWGPFDGVSLAGECAFAPAYWRARQGQPLAEHLGEDDRVIYHRGSRLDGMPAGSAVWADRVFPYFQRSDLKFCSHFHAPPRQERSNEPAILAANRWVLFADPVFTDYRLNANLAVLQAFASTMRHLIGPPDAGQGLKSTVRIYPLRHGNDLRLTLLHYVMERQTPDADIISERQSFAGQILRFARDVKAVRVWNGADLEPSQGGFALPTTEGRLLLEVPDFFC